MKSVHIWQMPFQEDIEFIHVANLPAPIPQQVSTTCKLVYFERGHKRFRYRRNRYEAASGDLLLIPPGESHGADAPEDSSAALRILYLPEDVFKVLLPENRERPDWTCGLSPPFVSDPAITQCFRQLHRNPAAFATPMEQQLCLLHLLESMNRQGAISPPSHAAPVQEHRAILRLKEYIEAHYAHQITLAHLAEISHLHPSYLCRVFTQCVGMPPHAYQVALRIDRVRTLLRRGLPAGQVAQETGFYDQSHLTRHFRRLMQMSPTEYSRKVKNVQDNVTA